MMFNRNYVTGNSGSLKGLWKKAFEYAGQQFIQMAKFQYLEE